ncbi:MAG: carbon storage regulator [Planctomycetes bacterium]|nr:carbon storage regulator [Planctomycetota bacterium]
MLVLTRKTGESIQIGEHVTVQVLETRGGRVRLGITAPSSIGVQRSEIVVDASDVDIPHRATFCPPTPPLLPALQRRRVRSRVSENQQH